MAFTEEEKRGFVVEIQSYLRSLAYFNKNIPMIVPSGIVDEATKRAVTAFQRVYGLSVTGDIDAQTYGAIVDVYKDTLRKREPAVAARPFENGQASIKPGGEGDGVHMLQVMLKKIAEAYHNIDETSLSGVADAETTKIVAQLQELMDYPPTGSVDAHTWNMIVKLYNSIK